MLKLEYVINSVCCIVQANMSLYCAGVRIVAMMDG